MILSWQQNSGTLVTGGNSNTIRVWDLGREQCVRVFNTNLNTCTTAIASKSVQMETNSELMMGQGNEANRHFQSSDSSENTSLSWTFGGFADGSVAIFDERVRGNGRVACAREHTTWVVSADFSINTNEIVTGSVRGTVKVWDLRTMRSLKTLEVHKSPLTALAVHKKAPIMATGSHAQFIKLLTMNGEQIGDIIKYHDGFLGQRIGPVSCLNFHPTKLLLAAGATDSIVAIYGFKDN